MQEKTKSITLLVDGSVLKKVMAQKGQQQTPQQIIQYLSHMVQAVRQQNPGSLIHIQYYGSRLNEPVKLPISGEPYVEPELKKGMAHHSVPGAYLTNIWGRTTYPGDQPWILRPSSLGKTELTDADFVFNERPKGVLTQLVGQMAEYAVCHPERPLYVYGDVDDMAYAIHTSQWLGSQIKRIEFSNNKPFISDIPMAKEPRFFDKERILHMRGNINAQPDPREYLKMLRAQCPEEQKKTILMVDVGVVRNYLEQGGYAITPSNVQMILDQITATLPDHPSKTILYCGFPTTKTLVSPFPGKARAMAEASMDKRILSLPNVEFSIGKTIQDERYPYILKREKWHTPVDKLEYRDFDYYFHQSDVDDRVAYDVAVTAMTDPSVDRLVMVTTDGDFGVPVEKAAAYGLPTWVICLDSKAHDMSFRLVRGAEAMIPVQQPGGLRTRFAEEEHKRESQKVRNDAKRKEIDKKRRAWARAEADDAGDYDFDGPTKSDREGANRGARRREKRARLQHRK